MRKEGRVLLGILTVVALALRIGTVSTAFVHEPHRADAGEYVRYAVNLTERGVFTLRDDGLPDSFRSPGYPLYLAGVRRVAGGDGEDASRFFLAVLGGLMVPLVFLLGRSFLPAWAALVAAGLTALSPHLVTAPVYLLAEALLAPLLLLAMLLLVGALRRERTLRFAAAGVAFGAAYLVNETVLLLAFALVAALLLGGPAGRRRRFAGAFLAAFLVFPAAWTVRCRLSVPAEVRRGPGRALLTAAHGAYPGFVHRDPALRYYPYRDDPEYPAWAADGSTFLRTLFRRASERPRRYLSWYLLEKPWHLWGFDYLQGSGGIYVYPTFDSPYQRYPPVDLTRVGMRRLHPAMVVLALAALPLWWRRRRRPHALTPALPIVALLVTTAVGMAFAPWPRYATPVKPLLYVTALWSVAELAARWRPGSRGPGRTPPAPA